MKHVKKMMALLLCLVMILALGMTAKADDTFSITINPAANDTGTHTYDAYQIFTGTLSTDGNKTLSNIVWGANVDKDNATKMATLAGEINALRVSTAPGYVALTATSSASDFADAIAELNASHDSEAAQAIAEAFSKVLTGSPVGSGATTITGLQPGYYFVKDRDNSLAGQEGAAYTRYILQVVGDVTASSKSEVPSIEKKIQEGTNLLSANSAAIGDKIDYVLNSTVPDMTGYNQYYFVINDTMSKGLTFNNDVAIKIGSTDLAENTDFTVEYTTDASTGVTSLKIVLIDFIQYTKNDSIKITYSATLNEDADLTATGNVNEVQLTYSNNPNYDYSGTNEPGSGEPVGVTPEQTVKTFTTGIKVIKVDAVNNTQTLTGAKFKLEGDGITVVLINGEAFELIADPSAADPTNTWYMLKNGTYTQDAPDLTNPDNVALYDDVNKIYAKITTVDSTTTATHVVKEAYVDANGVLTFEGLPSGTYTLTELVAPDGYNLLQSPITIVIDGTLDQTAMTCTWSATVNGVNATYENDLVKLTVENDKGSQLPSTGGIGTTIFYVIGGLMAVCAGVLLVVRRRMGAER